MIRTWVTWVRDASNDTVEHTLVQMNLDYLRPLDSRYISGPSHYGQPNMVGIYFEDPTASVETGMTEAVGTPEGRLCETIHVNPVTMALSPVTGEVVGDALKLFVWKGVYVDYSGGIAVALAHDVDEARRLIWKKRDETPEDRCYAEILRDPDCIHSEPYAITISGGS